MYTSIEPYLTRLNIFLGGVIGSILFIVSYFFIIKDIFHESICVANYDSSPDEQFAVWLAPCTFVWTLSMIALPLLVFGLFFLLTKKNERVFQVWKKFTFIYLFIYLFIYFLTPWYSGDAFLYISKRLIAILLSIIFSILSILIIIRFTILKNILTVIWIRVLYYITGFLLISAGVIVSGLLKFLINT